MSAANRALLASGIVAVALGALTGWPYGIAVAVPQLPRSVAIPLGLGAWTNANAFGALVVKPEWKTARGYQAASVGSFILTTVGFVGLAVVVVHRESTRESRWTPR